MKFFFTFLALVVIVSVSKAQCGASASIIYNASGFTGNFISTSVTPSSSIASYHWDFGFGNNIVSFTQNVTVVFPGPGSYVVKHFVTLLNGCHSDTTTVMVVINAVTPITLENFKATFLDKNIQLKWATINETNFSHFEMEKSADGILFNKIGSIPSSSTKAYSYTDISLLKYNNYYRLKMIDKDGSFQYSKTVSINNKINDFGFQMVNPSQHGNINISLDNYLETTTLVQVLDITGKLKSSVQTIPSNGRIGITNTLPKGNYIVKVNQHQQQSAKILVVQ